MTGADDFSGLPPVLARVAEACGRGAALRLASEFGGTVIYVPKKAQPSSPLVRTIGAAAVEMMIAEFGHGNLEIPLGPFGLRRDTHRAIRRGLAQQRSQAKVARAVGVHHRTVRRHAQRLRSEEPLPLFDERSKDR